MKKLVKSFVLVVIPVACFLVILARASERVEHRQSNWRIAVRLDTPNLSPAAVQWSLFEENPVPGYVDRLGKSEPIHRQQLERANSQIEKQAVNVAQMTVGWNLGFRKVTGDKVYLLTSGQNVQHSLSSNSSDGKKWLVSKVRQLDGKPVCWCLPIKVKSGKEIQVTLSEDNVFDLETAFIETSED